MPGAGAGGKSRGLRFGTITLSTAALLLTIVGTAQALPQFAVRSARACDTCHVEPIGWENPELAARKCTMHCSSCHVDPSGGGMRNESGIYYGRQTLPTWSTGPADETYQEMKKAFAELEAALPAGSQPAGSQPAGSQPAGSQPATSTAPASQPFSTQATVDHDKDIPIPGPPGYVAPPAWTDARYGGLEVSPWWRIGGDWRGAFHRDEGKTEDDKNAFFPMQLDIYLLGRAYNPKTPGEGRLTFMIEAGAFGARGDPPDDLKDRFGLKEWLVLYDNLPYNFYVKAGRFLPTYGWRFDDHTAFVRQEMPFLASAVGLDHERQVTGFEVGLMPNYPYASVSFFNLADEWEAPIDADQGWGTALNAGYKDLLWQAGGQFAFGNREERTHINAGAIWSVNFHLLSDYSPFIYLGEYDVRSSGEGGGQEAQTGLYATHELDWLIHRGVNFKFRYDWLDANIEKQYDSSHKYTAGIEWFPIDFAEIILQYRHNREPTQISNDEIMVQLHGWY